MPIGLLRSEISMRIFATVYPRGIVLKAHIAQTDWPHTVMIGGPALFTAEKQIDTGNVSKLRRAWHTRFLQRQ